MFVNSKISGKSTLGRGGGISPPKQALVGRSHIGKRRSSSEHVLEVSLPGPLTYYFWSRHHLKQ